jgi:hypothetical protein
VVCRVVVVGFVFAVRVQSIRARGGARRQRRVSMHTHARVLREHNSNVIDLPHHSIQLNYVYNLSNIQRTASAGSSYTPLGRLDVCTRAILAMLAPAAVPPMIHCLREVPSLCTSRPAALFITHHRVGC